MKHYLYIKCATGSIKSKFDTNKIDQKPKSKFDLKDQGRNWLTPIQTRV